MSIGIDVPYISGGGPPYFGTEKLEKNGFIRKLFQYYFLEIAHQINYTIF